MAKDIYQLFSEKQAEKDIDLASAFADVQVRFAMQALDEGVDSVDDYEMQAGITVQLPNGSSVDVKKVLKRNKVLKAFETATKLTLVGNKIVSIKRRDDSKVTPEPLPVTPPASGSTTTPPATGGSTTTPATGNGSTTTPATPAVPAQPSGSTTTPATSETTKPKP